jgi:transposase
MLDRHDLTDDEWARLEQLLPDRTPCRGGRWADHRIVINGVIWRTRSGAAWRDLPGVYGNWKTVYNRHRRGVVRAHQHAAGARLLAPSDVDAEVLATTVVDTGGAVE